MCNLYAVCVCVYITTNATERLWVRPLVCVYVCSPFAGCIVSSQLVSPGLRGPLCARPLKVASGNCAFNRVLLPADCKADMHVCKTQQQVTQRRRCKVLSYGCLRQRDCPHMRPSRCSHVTAVLQKNYKSSMIKKCTCQHCHTLTKGRTKAEIVKDICGRLSSLRTHMGN